LLVKDWGPMNGAVWALADAATATMAAAAKNVVKVCVNLMAASFSGLATADSFRLSCASL
jgi:hypothetical protein